MHVLGIFSINKVKQQTQKQAVTPSSNTVLEIYNENYICITTVRLRILPVNSSLKESPAKHPKEEYAMPSKMSTANGSIELLESIFSKILLLH